LQNKEERSVTPDGAFTFLGCRDNTTTFVTNHTDQPSRGSQTLASLGHIRGHCDAAFPKLPLKYRNSTSRQTLAVGCNE